MSTLEGAVPNQDQIQKLQDLLKRTSAQLMATQQTTQELLKANTDLRAELFLYQADKRELEAKIKAITPVTEVEPNADTVSV